LPPTHEFPNVLAPVINNRSTGFTSNLTCTFRPVTGGLRQTQCCGLPTEDFSHKLAAIYFQMVGTILAFSLKTVFRKHTSTRL